MEQGVNGSRGRCGNEKFLTGVVDRITANVL